MSYMKKYALRTEFEGMNDITAQVQEAVKESGIQEGFCIVHCNHTTAGLLVTSFWDKRGHVDFMEELDKIVPTRYDYRHQFDTPTDAAGHIKTALFPWCTYSWHCPWPTVPAAIWTSCGTC